MKKIYKKKLSLKKNEISLIIPCYNEEKNIKNLLNNIKKIKKKNKNLEIIIVENGSTDNSYSIIKKNNLIKLKKINLVKIKKNLGYGFGLVQGALKSKAKFISWIHADMQLNPSVVPKIYKKFKHDLNNKKVIIKGKRLSRNYFDLIFTKLMSITANFFLNIKLNDINSIPKIMPKQIFFGLKKYPHDFLIELFLLKKCYLNQYKIIEYPVTIKKRYAGKAKGGGSLIGKLNLSFKTLKYILNK